MLSLIQQRMPVIIEQDDWRIWLGEGDGFASVVKVANVRSISPSGERHSSHMPPNATGSPSFRAMAKGVLPDGSSH